MNEAPVVDTLSVELATLRAERSALRQAVSFFASVIKSGENWSPECERILRRVMDGPFIGSGSGD